MASRRVRLIIFPALLFLLVSGTVFVLAQWHPAKEKAAPAAAGGTPAQHGQELYEERCARCHDTGVAPELQGSGITIEAARTQIENGGGGMPADLVSGQDLEDVLAYLENVLGS